MNTEDYARRLGGGIRGFDKLLLQNIQLKSLNAHKEFRIKNGILVGNVKHDL